VELARRLGGTGHALHFARQFMMWYSRGLPQSAAYRRRAGQSTDLAQLTAVTEEYFAELMSREHAEVASLEEAS